MSRKMEMCKTQDNTSQRNLVSGSVLLSEYLQIQSHRKVKQPILKLLLVVAIQYNSIRL
jgi:hypothetical protein